MTRYLGTVLPGLEHIAAHEVTTKLLDAVIADLLRGKVYFDVAAEAQDLLDLRTVDNLYVHLGDFSVGPHRADLPAIGRRAAEAAEAAPLHERRSVWVNASRAGPHTYSRFDAAEAALNGILRRAPRWRAGTPHDHDAELRLDIDNSRGRLALRLTDSTFRFRGRERAFATAALRPPVAHALVWLTQPASADLFLDPFCGSGTIVAERAHYGAARILGSDTSADALRAARENAGLLAELHQWDARSLPLDPSSVDAVATNLPFGRRVGERAEMEALYTAFLRELQRVLAPKGLAIVLTELPDLVNAGTERTKLVAQRVTEVSLKGLHASVLRLSRT